jgi:hypothetical protein
MELEEILLVQEEKETGDKCVLEDLIVKIKIEAEQNRIPPPVVIRYYQTLGMRLILIAIGIVEILRNGILFVRDILLQHHLGLPGEQAEAVIL